MFKKIFDKYITPRSKDMTLKNMLIRDIILGVETLSICIIANKIKNQIIKYSIVITHTLFAFITIFH